MGIDNDGNSYNINADTAAGFIAGELKANKLLLLTDVAGILDQNKKLISSLTLDDASKIIDEDFIVGGMKPKILTCVEAMKKGVNKTTYIGWKNSTFCSSRTIYRAWYWDTNIFLKNEHIKQQYKNMDL